MTYIIIAAIAAVLFGVAVVTLKMLQSSARDAGAQAQGRAEAEATNKALTEHAEVAEEEAAIVMKETTKDETIKSLRSDDDF